MVFSRLSVRITSDERSISALKSAMTPEVGTGKKCRLSLRSGSDGKSLSLILSGSDLVSLRAGLNTNLRLASSVLKTLHTIQEFSSLRSQKD